MIKERISVFIDGSNLYHILKSLFPNKKPMSFDFQKLIDYLVKDRELVSVYYYNSPLDREKDEQAYRKQQQFFDKIKRIPLVHLVLCRMQKRRVNGIMIYEVKEDDIHLAVDMVKLAYKDHYDTAVVISSDGDFVPAIEAVRERNKVVENVGFENKFSWHLKQKSNKFIQLNKQDLEKLFD